MKNFISHKICDIGTDDPIVVKACYSRAFEWANKMGLEGKIVKNLTIVEALPEDGLLRQRATMWCKVECDEVK